MKVQLTPFGSFDLTQDLTYLCRLASHVDNWSGSNRKLQAPLSHISTVDGEKPVTPSHLICGRRLLSLPDGPYHKDLEDDFLEHSVLTKRLIELNKVLDHFWMRWKMEYLLELRNAHRPTARKGVNRPIHVEEVVIVQHMDLPTGIWKLGCVEALITGTDGKVRGASITIHSPDNRFTHLQWPIQLLYPLEVTGALTPSQAKQSQNCGTESTSTDITPPLNQARPRRVAAQNASAIIKTLTQNDWWITQTKHEPCLSNLTWFALYFLYPSVLTAICIGQRGEHVSDFYIMLICIRLIDSTWCILSEKTKSYSIEAALYFTTS